MDSTRSGSVFSLSVNCIPLNGARADFIIAALAPSGIWAAVTAVLDDAFWIKPEETWLYSLPFRVGKGHFRRPIRQLLNFRHHRVPSTHRHVCEEDQKSHKAKQRNDRCYWALEAHHPPKNPWCWAPRLPQRRVEHPTSKEVLELVLSTEVNSQQGIPYHLVKSLWYYPWNYGSIPIYHKHQPSIKVNIPFQYLGVLGRDDLDRSMGYVTHL